MNVGWKIIFVFLSLNGLNFQEQGGQKKPENEYGQQSSTGLLHMISEEGGSSSHLLLHTWSHCRKGKTYNAPTPRRKNSLVWVHSKAYMKHVRSFLTKTF